MIWERDCVIQVLPSGCMIWTGVTRSSGYGAVTHMGKADGAHRVAYMQAFGPIPDGLCVCHRCDIRSCINPDHLFLGTKGDNARDAARKGRTMVGSKNGNSRLSEGDVASIRSMLSSGIRKSKVSRAFGVSQTTIGHIAKGKTWAKANVPNSTQAPGGPQ